MKYRSTATQLKASLASLCLLFISATANAHAGPDHHHSFSATDGVLLMATAIGLGVGFYCLSKSRRVLLAVQSQQGAN